MITEERGLGVSGGEEDQGSVVKGVGSRGKQPLGESQGRLSWSELDYGSMGGMHRSLGDQGDSEKARGVGVQTHIERPFASLYLAGFVLLEVYCSFLHAALWGLRLPFLPLMLTSMYCALGIGWVWTHMLIGFWAGNSLY